MHTLIYEDSLVASLAPLALLQPAFNLSCGTHSLVEQIRSISSSVAAVVRPYLVDVLAEDEPSLADVGDWHASAGNSRGLALLVNSRLVPSADTLAALHDLIDGGRPGIVQSGDHAAAALLSIDQLPAIDELSYDRLPRWLADPELPRLDAALTLLEHPHDVVRHHLATMSDNLAERIRQADQQEIADGVFAAGKAELGPHVAADTSAGPIVMGENVVIGPFTFLQGPLYIAGNVRIREHASIRPFTSIGPSCKIGGEVEATIVEAYSNKQHYGFLGHSYVGRFVNLGAGTSISNLKNTYGTVRVRRGDRKFETGMQFLGAAIGDLTKTAINTSIYTGKIVGISSFVYGEVTENVPSFVNYARALGQVTEVTLEAAATTQQRTLARRGIQQRDCDVALLKAIHTLTAEERQHIAAQTGPPQF